jgi:hypothetical protein
VKILSEFKDFAIKGNVLDENGNPAAGCTVQLVKVSVPAEFAQKDNDSATLVASMVSDALGGFGDADDRVLEEVAQLHDPAFVLALLLLRRVVPAVFLQVTLFAGRFDLLHDVPADLTLAARKLVS